ncbi:ABC transporter permease [Nonomuraea typhae]|uniref:ABC transporter permease n=1 Tax=Nonomuraea typhae TaxID=2603600 RepID=UPI0012FBFAE4|nr:ABC transporter permease [Nonomuraea typhae]
MSVLASEWLKVRSVRSSHLIIGIGIGAVLLAAGLAWMAIGMYDRASPSMRASARIAELEEVVVIVPQLCLGILGVLSWTSDRVLTTSLAIVPKRWPLLAAKASVVGGLGLVVGPVVVFGTFFVSRGMLGGRYPVSGFAEAWPLLVPTSLSVAVFGLLGLGLGVILRSAAGAIGVLVGLVYVVPMIVGNLPEPWSERLGSVMIGALPREIAGASLASSVYGSLLPPVAAGLLLAAYAVLPLLAGAWLLRLRDA